MKAFQLKIAIKNSKPPIWRRVIVPAGITFSQLSMILNKVMGWSGYHLFEFEFYYLELRIAEEIDEINIGYGPYDYVEASTTYIREYLEENEWFTYTYDFGDEWQHRVTIEKVIDDYQNNYPVVIKYKGDCPPEDCGGIYGYYECLEIISDESHPEYEDRMAWMNEQGYSCPYDMDAVNQVLQTEYFYSWGKGEKRRQHMINEEHASGKYGLQATKRDKNKDVQINMSSKQRIEETAQMLQEVLKYHQQWEQMLTRNSLENIFEDYAKETLLEIAKEKGVKNVSNCSKGKLINKLLQHMLQPEIVKSYFLCLRDEEIKAFEKAMKVQGPYEAEDISQFVTLCEASYVGLLTDGRIVVPKEVADAYQAFRGKEFDAERKNISYLLCCLRAAGVLYGIAPMSVFMKLVRQNPAVHMTEEEIRCALLAIPHEISDYILVKDTLYQVDLYPDDKGLLNVQGNKAFYIPTLQEIIVFGTKGYISDSREAKKLKQFLLSNMDASPEEAEFACGIIQMQISADCRMQDIFDTLEELDLICSSENQFDELVMCINQLWNATRMVVNRGFTPNELSARSNVIDFAQAKKNKLSPNDPCPCGSGKKYKKCCRNKN